jgi:hypothetical protein
MEETYLVVRNVGTGRGLGSGRIVYVLVVEVLMEDGEVLEE